VVDSLDQQLAQWGWIQASCMSGKVIISGFPNLPNGNLCIEPTSSLPAGNYRFADNQLYRISTNSKPPSVKDNVESIDQDSSTDEDSSWDEESDTEANEIDSESEDNSLDEDIASESEEDDSSVEEDENSSTSDEFSNEDDF
jgi:hypothetical protein